VFKYTLDTSYQTATSGTDFKSLSGSVSVNGVTAEIPIEIIDDDVLEGTTETIVLNIYYDENDHSLGYVPGLQTTHTIFIQENDAYWMGSIENIGTSVHFKMKIIQSPSGSSCQLIGDGYGIIPENGDSTEWPVTPFSLTPSTFHAEVSDILIPAEQTHVNSELRRKLIFLADAGKENQMVDPASTIRGTLTEEVTCEKAAYLGYKYENGTFTLLKEIAQTKLDDLVPVPGDLP
jgi:hypothetical protein